MLVLLLAGCDGGEEVDSRPAPATTVEQAGERLDFGRVEMVAGNLEVPWDVAFVDRDTLLVTERPGRVRVVDRGRVREEPAAQLNVVDGEGGLLGIALHPEFAEQRFAYVYYTHASGNRLSRFRVTDDLRLENEELLIGDIPAASVHDGGRVAFGPDGMLYVTTGDAGSPDRAAEPGSLGGKILRMTPEGEVPPDNPFGDSPVWSYGHRNPQGLAWDEEGTLYAAEHGPSGDLGLCCHDEVNRIEKGGFYGWPFRAGRVEAGGGDPPAEPVAPIAASGEETWAPAGLAWREGALFVALLAGERLLRVSTDGERVETALEGFGRLRAAVIGPDECLYLTTSNRDGRGDPQAQDDRVLRVC